MVLASKAQMSSDGERGQDDDAVGEDEPVAAPGELARQEPVLAQDRGEDREAVEGGVRGQDQDRRGERLHREEADRVVAEHGAGDLGDDGALGVAGRGTDQLGRVGGDVDPCVTRASAVMPTNMAIGQRRP